jgi:hypothetical protein
MDSAGVCGGCEGDHHTELLECRFHGFSFDKMTLVTASVGEVIIPTATHLERMLPAQGFMGTSKAAFPYRLRPQTCDSTWANLVNALK